MLKRIIIMIGIQGSGKTTFCRRYFSEDYIRVNLDTLKTRNQERIAIESCMEQGSSFVVDNTNPTKQDRARYIQPAKSAGYHITGYFMESRVKECITRNERRTGKEKIPSKAIAATSNKMELPSYDEGFDELYFVKNDGETMCISEWRSENEI